LRNADCHSKSIALLYTLSEDVRLAPFYDMLTTCIYADYKDSPPGISYMGKKTWQPGKSLGKFLASQFGIQAREQAALVKQISDAVSNTAPLVREAMGEHPGFREMGKHLLHAWSDGVRSLRDKHAFALGG
jgi:serine/threonine-protein kinase HipA